MFSGCVIKNKDWQIFACLLGVCHLGLCLTAPSKKKKKRPDSSITKDVSEIPPPFFLKEIVLKKQCSRQKKASDRAMGQQGN